MGLGVVLMAAGVAGLVIGIVQAIAPDSDVLAEAVAQAERIDGGVLEADLAAGDHTVFVVVPVDGIEEEEGGRIQHGVVKDVRCTVERPGEDPLTLRGGRQAHGVSTDEVSSIGWFSHDAGTVRVTCTTSDPKDAERGLALAPGRPSVWAGGVVASVGGLAVGAIGWALAWWGWRARNPRSAAPLVGSDDAGWSV
jgi:hypothetical protein